MSDFSIGSYVSLLKSFQENGYLVVTYAECDPESPHLILRHDVDMDISRALVMAEAEAEIGVFSHYYVLLNADIYNPFSVNSRRMLNSIMGLGHKVGLHFDASIYSGEREALEDAAAIECGVLEDILGKKVETITFHRPAPSLLGLEGDFAGRLHAYDPRFFSQMGYCSDSEGRWRFGVPLEQAVVREKKALQLLTHPIWWVGEGSPTLKLETLQIEKAKLLERELALNCKTMMRELASRYGFITVDGAS